MRAPFEFAYSWAVTIPSMICFNDSETNLLRLTFFEIVSFIFGTFSIANPNNKPASRAGAGGRPG